MFSRAQRLEHEPVAAREAEPLTRKRWIATCPPPVARRGGIEEIRCCFVVLKQIPHWCPIDVNRQGRGCMDEAVGELTGAMKVTARIRVGLDRPRVRV